MYTIKQIAVQCGKSERTVRAWLKQAQSKSGDLGTFKDGQRRFSEKEVEELKSYGRDIPDKSVPITEVIEPELIDSSVDVVPGSVISAGQIVRFDVKPVSLTAEQVDFTNLELAADHYAEVVESAFTGVGQVMAQRLRNQINLAISQNDVAVKAMQAHAITQAVEKLGESQGHTGLIQ